MTLARPPARGSRRFCDAKMHDAPNHTSGDRRNRVTSHLIGKAGPPRRSGDRESQSVLGVRHAQGIGSDQILSLVAVDRIKIEDRVIFAPEGPRAEVVDLSRFRREMRERKVTVDRGEARLQIGAQVMLARFY
jgi:hypothetical protein